MAEAAPDSRIVLLGKTGSGKSSLANTLLKSVSLFKVCHSSTSGTVNCQSETRTVAGRTVQLIDTPGLFDTDPNAPDFKKEILNCMIEYSPGVHTFLFVLKVEKFKTKHELSVAEVICQHFSEEALKYTTVVFTQGDQMEEGLTIKEWIKDNEALSSWVQRCGGCCHVVDNKYWNNDQDPYRNNQLQVRDLLNTIDQTVKENGGRCYTNENHKKVQEKLTEETEKIKAAPENADKSDEEIKKQAKENTFNYFRSMFTKVVGVSALLGMVLLRLCK